MGVAVERSLGVTVLRLVPSQVPDDQSLVSATRQEHVGAVKGKLEFYIAIEFLNEMWSGGHSVEI